NADMTVKCDYFISYFLLKPDSRSNSDEHHHNSNSNCRNTNFYDWCGHTTFIRFAAYNSFRYKKLVIQNLKMQLRFKNTLFPIIMTIILLWKRMIKRILKGS